MKDQEATETKNDALQFIRSKNPHKEVNAEDLQTLHVAYVTGLMEQYIKEERQKCIDQIYQICGAYGEDREDIKSDFRDMCKYLKSLNQ